MDISVFCDQCGTELETTDASCDALLTVKIKTRPCSKCSRPSDCQLSCEDVLDREKELEKLRKKIKASSSLPKCFGTYDPKLEDVCIYCDIQNLCVEDPKFKKTEEKLADEEDSAFAENQHSTYAKELIDYDQAGNKFVEDEDWEDDEDAGTPKAAGTPAVPCFKGLTLRTNECRNCTFRLKCEVRECTH